MWDMINKINGKIKDKSCVIDHLKIDNIKASCNSMPLGAA